ncbi:MAG: C40 family peptidase [Pseudoclavibacter sp.]
MSTTLTRREARAIERQTGVRPVADATQALSAMTLASVATIQASADSTVEETGRIERNAITSLLSVVPAGKVPTVQTSAEATPDAARVPAAFAGERAMTVRAPRPKQLVARRRVAGGLAVAASLAAVTTVGAIVPSTMAAPVSEASLSSAVTAQDGTSDDTNADAQTDQAGVEAAIADAVADATPAVPAPETVTDRTETSVVSFSADQVAAVATPEPTAEATAADTSSASGTAGQSVVGASVVETASQFIGVSPYVFGGATPDGFDCSGLVKYVFGLHGIDVAHGVSAQAAAGTRVSDPQPGDLVIFPNFHVGIYAGNGQMIDAPTEGRMVELGGLDAGGSYYFVRL